MVPEVNLARQVGMACLELMVLQEAQGLQEQGENLESMDTMGSLVRLVLQDLLVHLGNLGLTELMAFQERMELMANLVKMVSTANLVLLEKSARTLRASRN